MKKISLILPVYNVEKFLPQCLKSIESLLNYNNELIIINDGSTDNSSLIIEKFARNYKNVLIVNQENKGLSAARNVGISKAKGEYLWFLDSDDYIDSKVAIRMIEHFPVKKKDIIIFGRVSICCRNKKKFIPYCPSCSAIAGIEYMEKALSRGEFRTNVWDKIYNHSFVDKLDLKFVENLIYEDMLFNYIAFTKAKSIWVFPEFVYYYNCLNNKSITNQVRIKDLDVLKFVQLAKEYFLNDLDNLRFAYSFNLLIFTWVNSCLVNKYLYLAIFNRLARQIIFQTINDEVFNESACYCSKAPNVKLKVKILALTARGKSRLYFVFVGIGLLLKSVFDFLRIRDRL